MKKGVFKAKKKNGEIYYRSNISRAGKHISLGSYSTEDDAAGAYDAAVSIYEDKTITLLNLSTKTDILDFEKAVSIINLRDNGIYFKTPIYLRQSYFSYFLTGIGELKFDNDDLFYYSSHRIHARNGHMYVNDFGMQYGILARFGIKNYAVAGKDYSFANGDDHDFRYQNIIIINRYHGVRQKTISNHICYETRIHIIGEYIIGRFEKDSVAAVAYNKAADAALKAGINKRFPQNYVIEYTAEEYDKIYRQITLPEKYKAYLYGFTDQRCRNCTS